MIFARREVKSDYWNSYDESIKEGRLLRFLAHHAKNQDLHGLSMRDVWIVLGDLEERIENLEKGKDGAS